MKSNLQEIILPERKARKLMFEEVAPLLHFEGYVSLYSQEECLFHFDYLFESEGKYSVI